MGQSLAAARSLADSRVDSELTTSLETVSEKVCELGTLLAKFRREGEQSTTDETSSATPLSNPIVI